MPFYLFEHNKNGEFREIFFHMDDNKVYNGEDGTEVGLWERRFYSPQMSVDTKVDEMSSRDFAEKSGKKKGTLGDLFDASKEASIKRERVMGKDFVKEKSIKDWKEKRKRKDGKVLRHPSEISRSWDIIAGS